MANQYKNALHYAVEELWPQLAKYTNIEVHAGERMIIYNDVAIPVTFGSTKSECLRKLKKLIAIEKDKVKRAEEAKLKERQMSLL